MNSTFMNYWLAGFALSAGLMTASCAWQHREAGKAARFPIKIDLKGDFELVAEKKSADKLFYAYESGDDYLVVIAHAQLTPESAENMANDKKFLVESLFGEQVSPYPGALSNTKGCPLAFHPKVSKQKRGADWLYCMELFANKNRVYGGCALNQIAYKSAYLLFWCSQDATLYEVKYYTPSDRPANSPGKLPDVVGCASGGI